MTDIMKRKFVALEISGKNYMTWVLNAEIHLDAMGLGDAIKDKTKASTQDCAKERYGNLKLITLPQAQYDWVHLRLQDFKSISEYNSAMFRITSKLKLCGDTITDYDMLEKMFTTFHASNMVLQQQYREKSFKKYSELISLLLVAEQNNDLLMRNHENRPTGSTPLPEVDEVYSHYAKRGKGRDSIRGHGRRQGRNFPGVNHPPKRNNHQKWKGKDEEPKANGSETECYRCGGKGHWTNICRIPRHLVELYQASLKNKGPEANFVSDNDFDITHLDVADFFERPDGKIDYLIGDGSVVKDD
ncbi:uncharacterized protein [Nicotiana sylvestris]|uniref:uncharacterized protein n=1 Tax=Nicotiana sylvestris TaxID=4096 RepID=UPI00388C9D94